MIQFPGPPHPNGMESPYTYSHTYFCNTIHYTRLHYITLHYTTLHYITGMHATSSYRQTGMHTYIGGTEASEQIWFFLSLSVPAVFSSLCRPLNFFSKLVHAPWKTLTPLLCGLPAPSPAATKWKNVAFPLVPSVSQNKGKALHPHLSSSPVCVACYRSRACSATWWMIQGFVLRIKS